MERTLGVILFSAHPDKFGTVTAWSSNAYVQCRSVSREELICESAGELLQPSLSRILTPERKERLAALDWQLDVHFGNYVKGFSTKTSLQHVADEILAVLQQAYGAAPSSLEIAAAWTANAACPPRHGPSQNLAGMIDDAPSMKGVSLRQCSYQPGPESFYRPSIGDPHAEAFIGGTQCISTGRS